MKTRGWLFMACVLAIFAIAPKYAMATDMGDIVEGPMMSEEERESLKQDIVLLEQLSDETAFNLGLVGDAADEVSEHLVDAGQSGFFGALNYFQNAKNMPMSLEVGTMAMGAAPFIWGGTDGSAFDTVLGLMTPGGLTAQDASGRGTIALLNSVGGYAATAGAESGLDTIEFNSSMLRQHERDVRGEMRRLQTGAFEGCAPGFVNRVWASPFHNYIKQKDRDLRSGYEYKMSGVAVGYDFISGPVSFGGAFTYSRGDYDWNDTGSDNKIDNFGASLYAQFYSNSGFFASVDGGYNYGDNEWERNLRELNGTFPMAPGGGTYTLDGKQRGDNHTSSYWVGGLLGYDFKTCSNFVFTPTVGLYWNHAESSAYKTRVGGDVANSFVGYGKFKKKSLLLPIELTATYEHEISDCSRLSLSVNAGYTYNFKKDGAKGRVESWEDIGLNGTMDEIEGVRTGRNRWNAGVAAKYNYKNFDFGVNYQYEGAKKYQSHNVSANVGLRF